ncbi:hypothetical protein L7F22_010789 [Adiantum nelumboides]|nr:hypothetical protein [Adiantum nelumboides]
MHLKGLRSEMYEECLLLYQKVYQGAPPNNEVGVHFAHEFTWQKCKGAEDSEGLVAWAVYAEGVIKMLRQQKTLNRKLEKWRSTNGPCLGSEWKFNAKNMPNHTGSTGTGFDWQMYSGGHQFSGQAKEEFLKKWAFGSMGTFGMSNVSLTTFFASTADVAAISNMKANAAEKLKEKQQCLEAIRIALDQSKTKRDEHVGLMRGAAKIIERLNKNMEELKLHKAGLVPNEEAMAKLETLIQIKKEALKDMGLDIEVHNLGNLGEEASELQKQAGEDTPDQQKAKKRAEKRADVVEAQGAASNESAEVPLKPKLAMNKDVEDAEKSYEKPIEKDTTVNLSDEDADLLISDVCGEILGVGKRGATLKSTPHQRKKLRLHSSLQSLLQEKFKKINEMEISSLEDETVEDKVAKQDVEQDADVTPDKVEEDQEPAVCPEIEEILPNCPGWGYLVLNFCKIKKLIILDLNGLFVKRDVSKRDPKTGQLEHVQLPTELT